MSNLISEIYDKIDNVLRWLDARIEYGDDWPYDFYTWLISWRDNIGRIIDFIPILWHDWDFDCEPGIYELIKKKLERLEPTLRHSVNAEKERKHIRTCIFLLDRIISDYYEEQFMRLHTQRWGDIKMTFEKNDAGTGYSTFNLTHTKVKTAADSEKEREQFRIGSKHVEQQRQNAIDYVMRMITKHSGSWWD